VVQGGGTKSIKGTVGELFLPGKKVTVKGTQFRNANRLHSIPMKKIRHNNFYILIGMAEMIKHIKKLNIKMKMFATATAVNSCTVPTEERLMPPLSCS
jgi:hypothetical protein